MRKCDCTCYCGDDPGIDKKEAMPCRDYVIRRESSKLKSDLRRKLHYPECWDTAVYPTINHALWELLADFHCGLGEDFTHK